MSLLQEKATQAIDILNEVDIDLWLTFVRETSGVRDPVLDFLIGPSDLTWASALMFTVTSTATSRSTDRKAASREASSSRRKELEATWMRASGPA